MSVVFSRVSGTIVNLNSLVVIFHFFSSVLICSIARLVLRAAYLWLYGPAVICVMSSANDMYAVVGSGGGRSCVYKL